MLRKMTAEEITDKVNEVMQSPDRYKAKYIKTALETINTLMQANNDLMSIVTGYMSDDDDDDEE